MVALVELEKLVTVRDLIQAGCRLSIVRSLTGSGKKMVIKWWWEIYGTQPPGGKFPETVLSFISNPDSAARISAFAVLHKRLHGTMLLDGDVLLQTWREYQRMCGPFNINAGYFVVRDCKAQIVMLTKCHTCHAAFIYDEGNQHTKKCPFCGTAVVGGRKK